MKGGNDEDVLKFHSIRTYVELAVVFILGIIADLFQHRVAFLFVSLCVIVAAYLWLDFYGRGTITTLYWTLWLLICSEASTVLARSYIVGQTERRVERARWLIRLVMIEWVIVMFSPFYPEIIAELNERIFGSREITINIGYYLMVIGVFFTCLFYFRFQTIAEIYGKPDLSHQETRLDGDVEDNTSRVDKDEESIWKGKRPKRATVTAVVEYMLDIKEEEERKALIKHQQEESQAQKEMTDNTCQRISGKAVLYLIYVVGMNLVLHLTFQISFNLFEKMIPVLMCQNFQISRTIFDWIYILANGLGLLQYYFLERFTVYRNVSYYFMIIGIVSFLCISWAMIHGETIFVFLYSQSQKLSSSSEVTAPVAAHGSLYTYIQVVILIVGMMLSYAFSYPLSMMSNLITYSCIPVPSFNLCWGNGPRISTRPRQSSLEVLQDRIHSIGFNSVQAIYSMCSVLGVIVAEWILKYEKIHLSNKLTTLGEFITTDPTQGTLTGHRAVDGNTALSVQDEMEILYSIIFLCSLHLLILCCSGADFEWIFSTTRRQRELLASGIRKSSSLSMRHWIGIVVSIVNIIYVIMVKRL